MRRTFFVISCSLFALLWAFANIVALRATLRGPYEWDTFFAAGSTVGSRALLDAVQHHAWQHAHHVPFSLFAYVPATAWLFWPEAHLPFYDGYVIFAVFMVVTAIAAAVVLATVYDISIGLAILGVFAWSPTTTGIITGQQAPLGLLFEALAIAGIVRGSFLLTGLSVGLLLYKPTDAVVFIVLLLVRRSWRSLGIVALCAACWYVASVAATAGDFAWPLHYLVMVHTYFLGDFAGNARQSISVPQLLLWAHAPTWLAFALGLGVLLLAVPKLSRSSTLEAASVAPVVGIAASPHVWPYDVTLMLPTVFQLAKANVAVLLPSYFVAALWIFYPGLGFNPQTVLVIATLAYALLTQRRAALSGGDFAPRAVPSGTSR